MSEAITPKQYAKRLGVSETKVLTWIRAGELRALNVATRKSGRPRWKITTEAIEEFEAARTSTPPPTVPMRRRADYKRYV